MSRDMTVAQFNKALAKHGMKWTALGYVCVRDNGKSRVCVYPGNAGPRRRAQLAYLIRERDRDAARDAIGGQS